MIPDDIDPSLRSEPLLESLDDGFSPPVHDAQPPQAPGQEGAGPPELGAKSPF